MGRGRRNGIKINMQTEKTPKVLKTKLKMHIKVTITIPDETDRAIDNNRHDEKHMMIMYTGPNKDNDADTMQATDTDNRYRECGNRDKDQI